MLLSFVSLFLLLLMLLLFAAGNISFSCFLSPFVRLRASICAAMSFCMSHGSSSAEICSCLTQSLTLPDTALTMRLARTYLLSDLIANSSAQTPHAWTYRHHLEKNLPLIADHWSKGISFRPSAPLCRASWLFLSVKERLQLDLLLLLLLLLPLRLLLLLCICCSTRGPSSGRWRWRGQPPDTTRSVAGSREGSLQDDEIMGSVGCLSTHLPQGA